MNHADRIKTNTYLANSLRSRLSRVGEACARIVANLTDEEIIAKYNAYHFEKLEHARKKAAQLTQ